jgi:hypothetical protein
VRLVETDGELERDRKALLIDAEESHMNALRENFNRKPVSYLS